MKLRILWIMRTMSIGGAFRHADNVRALRTMKCARIPLRYDVYALIPKARLPGRRFRGADNSIQDALVIPRLGGFYGLLRQGIVNALEDMAKWPGVIQKAIF